MKKILVLGGCGRQGSIIVNDLVRSGYYVVAADREPKESNAQEVIKFIVTGLMADVEDKIFGQYDLVVGALPSSMGRDAMSVAVRVGVDYIDLSFMEEDPQDYFGDRAKSTILHDCGLAPGLSHLVTGRAIERGFDDISIMVGGVAKDREKDYVITWSPEDLYEEYTRPARIVLDGKVVSVPALSDQVEAGVGPYNLKAFYSDGLRSLLKKSDRVNRMEERTLRWPGHIDLVGPMIYGGDFAGDMKKRFEESNEDLVLMKIMAWKRAGKNMNYSDATLIVYGDDELSAMARTTALSCSAFVHMVAEEKFKGAGVFAPEDVAVNDEAYRFVLDHLRERGVDFYGGVPFE